MARTPRKPYGSGVSGFLPTKGDGTPVTSYGGSPGSGPGYVSVVNQKGGVRAAVQAPELMSQHAPIPNELRVSMGAPGAQKSVQAQHADHVGMTAADHAAMAARHRRVAKANHMDQAYHQNMAAAHEAAANVSVIKNKPKTAFQAVNSPQYGTKKKSSVSTPL